MIAILNHMPLWAGVAVGLSATAGYFMGAWITRDDVKRGYRRYWWRPW